MAFSVLIDMKVIPKYLTKIDKCQCVYCLLKIHLTQLFNTSEAVFKKCKCEPDWNTNNGKC